MKPTERERVERVFQEQGWENLQDIDDWRGDDLEALRSLMSEEQYEALVDALADLGEDER